MQHGHLRDCTVLDHKETEGHIAIGIKKATDNYRHTLEDQLLRSRVTQDEIQSTIQEVESEIEAIQDDKDLVTENLAVFIQYAQHELNQFQQKATDTISEDHSIIDPHKDELKTTLNTSYPDCTVVFTPQISGRHEISIMCLGNKLKSEQTHIIVNSNNPVLKFGIKGNGKGAFNVPWSIAKDNNGVLYVADRGNRLIQKFSDNGEFINQFCVNNNDNECTTVDMALDQNNGLIHFVELQYKGNAFYPWQIMLAFNLDGELQHTCNLSNSNFPICRAINRQQDIIISDITKKCLCKYDKQGNYFSSMGFLKCPAFITIGEDDCIIVADRGDDCICIFNPDGSLRHTFRTSGTGKGQLRRSYVYVADMNHHCIKKYKYK